MTLNRSGPGMALAAIRRHLLPGVCLLLAGVSLAQAQDAPIGMPDAFQVPNDDTLNIAPPGFLVNDIDPQGEALTAVSVADNVDNGTLAAFADGSFNYTPNDGFTGSDSFTYRMRDASNNFSEPVLVSIEVLGPANRVPTGIPDNFTAILDTPLNVPAAGFLVNDFDLDGEAVTAVSVQDSPDNGGLAAFADGSFTYTPNAGFTGSDSFEYRMRDASNNFSGPVLVTLVVVDPDGDVFPIGTPDAFQVPNDQVLNIAAPGFLINDTDPQGEALTAVSVADNVDNGTLAAFADGSFNYTPNDGFTGSDSFTYRMRDASNNFSEPVLVSIEVLGPANRTPTGVPDSFTAILDTTLNIPAAGFLVNDFDPDGEALTAVSVGDNVDHGTLAAFADGSFSYVPDAGFTGSDSFTYRMQDASSHLSGLVQVTLNVIDPAVTGPVVELAPASLDFGTIAVGSNSAAQAATLRNVGAGALTVGTLAISGAAAASFSFETDDCSGQVLAYFASCSFEVSMAPTSAGALAASVDIPSDAATSPDSVALAGTGEVPAPEGALTISPGDIDFGFVIVGDTGGPIAVTLGNTGGGTLGVSGITVPAGPFALAGGSCPAAPFVLAPAQSCTLAFSFSPAATGIANVAVTVTSDAASSPDSFNASGEGVDAPVPPAPGEAIPVPALGIPGLVVLVTLFGIAGASRSRRRRHPTEGDCW